MEQKKVKKIKKEIIWDMKGNVMIKRRVETSGENKREKWPKRQRNERKEKLSWKEKKVDYMYNVLLTAIITRNSPTFQCTFVSYVSLLTVKISFPTLPI